MLTLALHHDESVFVYLKEAGKGKHQIEQLGLFPSVFSFDQQFLYQKDAELSFRKMLKDILEVLSLKDEALYLSFSAQLCYFSFYENIPKDDIRELVDKDIWLTKLKFGADFAERNECQVKALYKPDNRVSLICIYYPKLIREMISMACRELSCQAAGLGIHIFNISEVARLAVSEKEYVIAYFHRDMYEVMHIADDYVRGYARFS
ncbi:MAG: hypothetical protein U5N26_05420 [Candidatus Marinimicrobia bacterium]|nr:hypothetical protein [Candidatus Neomarinimicrobiota bacterium]